MAMKEIRTATNSQCLGYLECLSAILDIDDGFMDQKIHMIFGIPRVNETIQEFNDKVKITYGLGKSSSSMKKIVKYYSTMNLEKSLLDLVLSNH